MHARRRTLPFLNDGKPLPWDKSASAKLSAASAVKWAIIGIPLILGAVVAIQLLKSRR
jgi:hypothetical protein